MPLLSLYRSSARPWRVMRAAGCGAGVGALAALFKMLAPSHAAAAWTAAGGLANVAGTALAFAVLFAAAASLRNFLARRLVWRQD